MNIQQYVNEARDEDLMSTHNIQKHAFQSLVKGMIHKVSQRSSNEAQEQLETLKQMDNFLDQLSHKNCIFIFQSKWIAELERQNTRLSQDNIDLLKENNKLKLNIKL